MQKTLNAIGLLKRKRYVAKKSNNRVLLTSIFAFFLILNSPLYGTQQSHEGHFEKTGAVLKKDLTLDNMRIKVELITMKAHMETMEKEMHHKMPMGRHNHGEIVHGPAHENLTHHLIVEVIDVKTEKVVKDAVVDLRLTYPKGEEKSLMLHAMTMKGVTHYSEDLDMSQKGNYLFELLITREGIEKKTSFEVTIE